MHNFDLIEPDEEVYANFSGRFAAYNSAHSTWELKSYSYVLYNQSTIIAGGRGIINMGALEVRGLWVDDSLRNQGIGKKLMESIENEAIKRGARRAMLYTYSWQAQGFYENIGYEVFSRFKYPDGPERIDMQKELSQ